MSPEAQRIAIAEACGWHRKGGMWHNPKGTPIGFTPDYPNDLNAMAVVEKYASEHLMDADQWEQFGRELEKVHPTACILASGCDTKKSPIDYYDLATLITGLTAARRAEAFLRTLKLWKETA